MFACTFYIFIPVKEYVFFHRKGQLICCWKYILKLGSLLEQLNVRKKIITQALRILAAVPLAFRGSVFE